MVLLLSPTPKTKRVLFHQEKKIVREEDILMPFLRPFSFMQLPQVLRHLEQDAETVMNILQPGPLGIIEHKFSAAEVQKAKSTVKGAIQNWRRNADPERNGHV